MRTTIRFNMIWMIVLLLSIISCEPKQVTTVTRTGRLTSIGSPLVCTGTIVTINNTIEFLSSEDMMYLQSLRLQRVDYTFTNINACFGKYHIDSIKLVIDD